MNPDKNPDKTSGLKPDFAHIPPIPTPSTAEMARYTGENSIERSIRPKSRPFWPDNACAKRRAGYRAKDRAIPAGNAGEWEGSYA